MQRIGVFVCWCGSNIAATVDVAAVAQTLAKEPGVVYAADYQYMCSEAGQNLMIQAISDHRLTGVVICSCSPRMHEATFRKAAARAGLNPYLVEIANIREQCSWIHKDKAEATEKAIILGRAAIAKVQLNAPLTPGTSPVTKRALVIGGGIAGIQTALDIADAGFEVDIVEKQPTIGGKMTQIDKTFPTLDCAACILTPKMVDCAQNEKINIFAYSEVEEVKGFVGSFTIAENVVLGYHRKREFSNHGLIRLKERDAFAQKVAEQYDVRMDSIRDTVGSLSGGNQQKVIIGRVFAQDPKVIIAAQPTRGVDIGAIEYIHAQILKMRDAGKAILLISADLEELTKLSDEIAGLYAGRIVDKRPAKDYDEKTLGALMTVHAAAEEKGA